MRRLNILVAAALITFAGCQGSDESKQEIPDGPASTFTLHGYTGNTITLRYADGKRDVMNKSGEGTFPAGDAKRIIHSIELEGGATILVGRSTKSGPITLQLSGNTPVLRASNDNYFPIGTLAELQLVNTALRGHYRQGAPIDLLSIEWTPIGHADPFTGSYDGGGHTISNLKIDGEHEHSGLFGQILDATIKDVHVTSGSVAGPIHVGAICGLARGNSAIISCSNAARVSGIGEIHGTAGICGEVSADLGAHLTISDCHNTGQIAGCGICNTAEASHGADITICTCTNTGQVIGSGICGDAIAISATIAIVGCHNSGRVGGQFYIGGICAGISANVHGEGYPDPFLSIVACSNKGAITGKETCTVGGIVGGMDSFSDSYALGGSVTACYNSGRVAGESFTGGICGEAGMYSLITACYNIGALTGEHVGSICGTIPSREITIEACYWANVSGNKAEFGVGLPRGDDGIVKFSATSWPSTAANPAWGTGDPNNDKYWKSLGSWNSGKPTYPTLFFEE